MRCNIICKSLLQYSTVHNSMIRCNTMQCDVMQLYMIQYNTCMVRYCTFLKELNLILMLILRGASDLEEPAVVTLFIILYCVHVHYCAVTHTHTSIPHGPKNTYNDSSPPPHTLTWLTHTHMYIYAHTLPPPNPQHTLTHPHTFTPNRAWRPVWPIGTEKDWEGRCGR